jgi:hypothetical protein
MSDANLYMSAAGFFAFVGLPLSTKLLRTSRSSTSEPRQFAPPPVSTYCYILLRVCSMHRCVVSFLT